jgi:U3 small nucleolar RNA-associated protein 22
MTDAVWDLTDNPSSNSTNSNMVIRFGFIIIREAAYKLIEKCDAENSVLAQSFKDLWGEKSQLRRFKDGTMCETVAFEDKHQIIYQMLTYIFQSQFELKCNIQQQHQQELRLNYIDCQIENVIEKKFALIKKLDKPKQIIYNKGKRKKSTVADFQEVNDLELDTTFNKASSVFDDLSKLLRSLEGLPLQVSSIYGTSPILRFASVYPTPQQQFPSSKTGSHKIIKTIDGLLLAKAPKLVEPINIVLLLETSGKWPDDIAAVDRLKCAFLTKIGQLLHEQFGLYIQVYPRWLDVLKVNFTTQNEGSSMKRIIYVILIVLFTGWFRIQN